MDDKVKSADKVKLGVYLDPSVERRLNQMVFSLKNDHGLPATKTSVVQAAITFAEADFKAHGAEGVVGRHIAKHGAE